MYLRLLLLILAGLLSLPLLAQNTKADSTNKPPLQTYTLRYLDKEAITAYQKSPYFNYYRKKAPERLSVWEQVVNWLWRIFFNSLDTEQGRNNWLYVLYTFATITMSYLLIKLIGADKTLLLYGGSAKQNKNISLDKLTKEIQQNDFDDLIQDALKKANYALALRYYYLKTLRMLNDKQYIDWKVDKTNYDYWRELKNTQIKNHFKEITFYFEYAYYGKFSITEQDFAQAQQAFYSLEKSL